MPCPIAAVTQIGNAVAPPMAAALGRCLLLAAAKKAPVAEPVIPVSEACTAYPAFLFSVDKVPCGLTLMGVGLVRALTQLTSALMHDPLRAATWHTGRHTYIICCLTAVYQP